MNAYIEKTIGSIHRETLDYFLLISEKQVRKIILEYIEYYIHYRLHQGIDRIPDGDNGFCFGNIRKKQILGGLHHLTTVQVLESVKSHSTGSVS